MGAAGGGRIACGPVAVAAAVSPFPVTTRPLPQTAAGPLAGGERASDPSGIPTCVSSRPASGRPIRGSAPSDDSETPRWTKTSPTRMELFVSHPDRLTSDPSLLERVDRGEPGATDALVDRYGALVWSLAIRAIPDRVEAEDAVQEIFISLWENAGRYDPAVAAEATFVAMIARRRLIDRRRRAGRRPDHDAGGGERLDGLESGSGPDDEAARRDETGYVFAALAELRPEQQRVLTMSIGGDRTYEQIAEALDMPIGTVKTHARRGLIRLRDLLAKPTVERGAEART